MINFLSTELNDELILISSLHGRWKVLEKKEFEKIKKNEINSSLIKELTEKGLILTEKNKIRILNEFSSKNDFILNHTSSFIFGTTNRCSHNCIYCCSMSTNEKNDETDMDFKVAKKIIDFSFNSPSRKIIFEFQGGEPLLNFKLIKEASKYIKNKNKKLGKKIIFNIATNLEYMDEDKLDFLVNNKFNIGTSLDGPEFIHNKNRKLNSNNWNKNYEKVRYWMSFAKKKYNYEINPTLVITSKSLNHHKDIIDEYVKNEFSSIHIKPMIYCGRAYENWEEVGYTPKEFFNFWKKSIDYIYKINKKGKLFFDTRTLIIILKILGKEKKFMCLKKPCGAFFTQLSFDNKGNIYPCDSARSETSLIIGNVFKDSYKNLREKYFKVFLKDLLPNNIECQNCAFLPFCHSCYTSNKMMLKKNSDSNEKNNFYCELNKLTLKYIFSNLHSNREFRWLISSWIKKLKIGNFNG